MKERIVARVLTIVSIDRTNEVAIDSVARQQALDIHQSFVVSAPAGSGKTELLIQRVLRLLVICQQPEEVLMITFTRKASAEMRERIIRALEKANEVLSTGASEPSTSHELLTHQLAVAVLVRDDQLGWHLLVNHHRLQVRTIDSLCRFLVVSAGLDSDFLLPGRVTDNADLIYEQAVSNLLAKLNSNNKHYSLLKNALLQLLDNFDNNINLLTRLFCDLLYSRASWLPLMKSADLTTTDIQHNFLLFAEELVEHFLSQLTGVFSTSEQTELALILSYVQEQLPNLDLPRVLKTELGTDTTVPNSLHVLRWQNVIRTLLLTKEGLWRKQLNKNHGFPATKDNDYKQRMMALIEPLRSLPELLVLAQRLLSIPVKQSACFSADGTEQSSSASWPIMDALTTVLPFLVAELNLCFQNGGESDHTAVSLAALNALQTVDGPTKLALRLDYRIQHILVDEFQDTSLLQVRLLELLSSGWQQGDGRSLFIVGDGMQSIYSFRQANVGLFISARERGIGHVAMQPLIINNNFRSQQLLVEWVNQTFANIFPQQDDPGQNQTGYFASSAVKAALPEPAVFMDAYQQPQLEAQDIAKKIEKILTTSDDSVAILVRNRPHLQQILPALVAKEISWQANDIEPISQHMAVIDLHSLAQALHSDADRIAWIGFLRSPVCGLDMHDLFYLCNPPHNYQSMDHLAIEHQTPDSMKSQPTVAQSFPPIWQRICELTITPDPMMSPQGQRIIQRIQPIIANVKASRSQLTTRTMVEWCWRALGGPQSLQNQEAFSAVHRYLSLLEEHQGQMLNWANFEQALQRSYVQPITKPGASRVQIMTIHKSKGLEFDHVFIPALERTGRNNEDPLLRWWEREYEDGTTRLLISPKPATGKTDVYYDCLKQEENRLQHHELCRLLYVGCTRAIKHLYLSAVLKQESIEENKPAQRSLLKVLWPQYEAQFLDTLSMSKALASSSALSAQVVANTESIEQGLWRLPSDFVDAATGAKDGNSAFDFQQVLQRQQQLEPWVNRQQHEGQYYQQQLGVLLHSALKQIVVEGQLSWQAGSARRRQQNLIWQAQLDSLGFDEKHRALVIKLVNQGIDNTLADNIGLWLLDDQQPNNCRQQSVCEWSIDYLDAQNKISNWVIDRSFVEKGQRWIIDYKSSIALDNETEASFFQRQRSKHSKQLQSYANVLKHYEPIEDQKLMLYFPLLGKSCFI